MLAPLDNLISLLRSVFQIYRLSKPSRDFDKGRISFPILLQVQTTTACNGKCPFCPYPYVSRELPQGKMEWETYQKIVDECVSFPSLRFFTLMLQNEPLLDKDICKAIYYFKEKSEGRVPVFIVTNGYLLTPSLIKQLIDSRLDHLIISLNAHKKETYEELMPGFKFEKILNNIDNLLSSDLHRTKVTLRFLENQRNKDEIREGLSYWHEQGVHTEVLPFISNRADTVDISALRSERSQMLPGSKIKQKAFSFFSDCCILPFYQMNILFNGDVLLCCNDWRRSPVLGNVKRDKLTDIWQGNHSKEIKTKILHRDYRFVEACKGCSVTEHFGSWR